MEKVKVLLMDSCEEERERTKEILQKMDNVDLIGNIADGKLGAEMVIDNKIDFVVMDLVLQNYDGFEFLERIQNAKNKPQVFVLSSLKNEGFAQKAINMGVSYVMAKPVQNDLLKRRLSEFFGKEHLQVKNVKTPRVRALEEKISNIFITVGIPAHIKGYHFLREAIKMAIDEPDIINSITKQLYPSIAIRFSTSASKVERAIRHAIEVAWNRGKIENINNVFGIKVYDTNEKPTNGEFIALVADKMLVEGA